MVWTHLLRDRAFATVLWLHHGQGLASVLNAIKRKRPASKVVFYSSYPERHYAVRLVNMGASEYVQKNSSASEIIAALIQAYNNKIYLSKPLSDEIASNVPVQTTLFYENHIKDLSNKEFMVLRYVGSRIRSKDIAYNMSISEKTVSTHIANICRKLNLDNRSELLHYAIKNGISFG